MNKSYYFKLVTIGILSAVALLIAWFIVRWLGNSPFGKYAVFSGWITWIFAIYAVYTAKQKNNGFITLPQGLAAGAISALTSALISAVIMFVWLNANNNELLMYINNTITYIAQTKEEALKAIDLETYNTIIAQIKTTQPADLALDHFIKNFIFQLVAVFLGAAYFRTLKPKTL